MTDRFRLVVIGDSTSFTDDKGPQLPTDTGLYPHVVALALEQALDRPVALSVLARAGTDSREAWKLVTKDRHAQFEVLMGADAVIVGVGSIDHAPIGVLPSIEAIVPYIRPASLRRRARLTLRAVQPWVVRATRARYSHTPRAEFARFYDGLLLHTRALTHGAAGVALGPTSHTSSYYGDQHPQLADRTALQREIAERHGFPYIETWALVQPHSEHLNPDGIHWPREVHSIIGERLALELTAQLRGDAPKPPSPF